MFHLRSTVLGPKGKNEDSFPGQEVKSCTTSWNN